MLQQTCLPRPHEKCGVIGIHGHVDAARLAYFGLYALQHRGQKSAGLVSHDGSRTWSHKGLGLVPDVFSEGALETLRGDTAIGHVQDTISCDISPANIQPFTASHRGRTISVAHNGSITNLQALRNELEEKGAIFHSAIESEIIVHLLARCADLELMAALKTVLARVKGAYSMLLLVNHTLVAVRDPNGFRPLCLGGLADGGYVVASETCALDLVEAHYVREIEPGEILLIDSEGLRLERFARNRSFSFCIFEQVYFARPDSRVFGLEVYECRKRMGEMLARECTIEADLVMPFPDSGTYAALGYAQSSGLPFEMGMIRNHYIGRTFMQPSGFGRSISRRMKLNPIRSLLNGKRVLIIEDSMMSGKTAAGKIHSLREAGASEVHLLVSCPPIRFRCRYGIHVPSRGKLLARGRLEAQIRDHLGLDSLHYLSLEGLLNATSGSGCFCKACIDGLYPAA